MRCRSNLSAALGDRLPGPARLPLVYRFDNPILRHLARVGGQGTGMPFIETMTAVVKRVLGTNNEAMLRRLMPIVNQVTALEGELLGADDTALRSRSAALKERVIAGASLDSVLPEAFALAREAADRRIGMWNALDPKKGFPEDAWGDAKAAVDEVRTKLSGATPTPAWDLDLPASAYAAIRRQAPHSVPPYRMRAHDVQILGAIALHQGRISEMRTGEGKTLVASLTCFLNALGGRGVHVVTVNDYLANRDAMWNAPTFRFLGVSVGALQNTMPPFLRKQAYACDITYGTNSEFGFDYLRDNLARSLDEQVQTRRTFAVIDEVDSVLIDEARTPLIISGPAVGRKESYKQSDEVARQLIKDTDFEVDIKDRHITLSEVGIDKAAKLFGVANLYDGEAMHLPHFLDNALKAHHLYMRDKEYLVANGQVKIVDEFTGRTLEGRRWSDGLHQAVETKEGVEIREENQTYATITIQNFFRLYGKLAGMTGTAMTEANEFNAIYKLAVVAIPPNKRVQRKDNPDLIFGTEKEKFEAILKEVEELHAIGQPVLVGTISVDISERLSELLKRKGVPHNVLNARQHQREAEVVANAGQFGAVTISTNMAGRGTDIVLGAAKATDAFKHWQAQGLMPKRLRPDEEDAAIDEASLDLWAKHYLGEEDAAKLRGSPNQQILQAINTRRRLNGFPDLPLPSAFKAGVDVRLLGGLRIVGTERHESRRIDNQLRGRSGRQGDPGSSRFYLSLDDDLMKRFAGATMANAMRYLGLKDGIPIESGIVTRQVEKAQKKVEEIHYGIRKHVLEMDQVVNTQRSIIYRQRQQIIEGRELDKLLTALYRKAVDDLVQKSAADGTRGAALAARISEVFAKDFGLTAPPSDSIPVQEGGDACRDVLMTLIEAAVVQRRTDMGEVFETVLRIVLLDVIDRRWKDHLYAMDHLRHAIGLESYAQKDPRLRFKEEGYRLFMMMNELIQSDVAKIFFRLQVQKEAVLEDAGAAASLESAGFKPAANAPARPALPAPAVAAAAAGGAQIDLLAPASPRRPGANDSCPCGSGIAFKNCHGK
jgi:preprotein translocase subunit SecA